MPFLQLTASHMAGSHLSKPIGESSKIVPTLAENFWSLLKRALKGTYVNVEPFHLFRYLDEQAFRFNERKNEDGDQGRFVLALQGVVGKGIRYAKLIAAEGGDGPCPA